MTSLARILAAMIIAGSSPVLADPVTPRDPPTGRPVEIEMKASETVPPGKAEASTVAVEPPADRPFSLRGTRLTGDWGGPRTKLEELGIRTSIFLNDQYMAVLKGGRDTGGSGRNSASMDALITFDLEKLNLVPQADVLLHLQVNWGGSINDRTGALFQVNDDADGSIGGHVAQLWYRQHFLKRKASLMLGYLDYQTIVDRNAYANSEDKQFMNLALDNNPLVPLRIGMGAALTLQPTNWYTLILGIADGQARPYKGGIKNAFHDEAWYTVYLENGFHLKVPTDRGPLPGNYRVGAFYDPGPRKTFPRSRFDDRTRAGDYGLYVSLDQMLFRENDVDDQGLGVFGRFAYRSPENNRLSRFWSGGLAYTGLIPGRDEDVLGAAFTFLRSSHLYRNRVDDSYSDETVHEIYYAIQVNKWLVISPDLQYIDNPGGAGDHGHAIVAGLRTRVSF